MKWVHAGPAQPDQVDAPRPGPVETIARGRELSSASSGERAAPEGAQTPRPTDLLLNRFIRPFLRSPLLKLIKSLSASVEPDALPRDFLIPPHDDVDVQGVQLDSPGRDA